MKRFVGSLVLLSFLGILIFTLGCANTKIVQIKNSQHPEDKGSVGFKKTIGF